MKFIKAKVYRNPFSCKWIVLVPLNNEYGYAIHRFNGFELAIWFADLLMRTHTDYKKEDC